MTTKEYPKVDKEGSTQQTDAGQSMDAADGVKALDAGVAERQPTAGQNRGPRPLAEEARTGVIAVRQIIEGLQLKVPPNPPTLTC
jgi:hypothetical protein